MPYADGLHLKIPAAILLGGNKLNRGVFDRLRERGLRVIVVDWGANPELRGDQHLQIDVKDTARVLEALSQIGDLDVHVAYTSTDVAVPTVMAIHRKYGLEAPENGVLAKPLTKGYMTKTWREAGLLNRFSEVLAAGDVAGVRAAASSRKVIVKPNLSSCSRGITILEPGASDPQLSAALRRAESTSFDGQAIVEEFFPGREFTVEMLGDAHGNVSVYAISVKYHTVNAGPNRVANKLHYNSVVYADETYQRIADYGRRCYQSLGIRCALGHLEIILGENDQLSPVEIGARSSGLIVTPLAETASGRDFLGDYLAVLRGARLEPGFHQSPNSAVYFFYDFPPDRPCRRATHLGEHLPPGIEVVYSDRPAMTPGQSYNRIDNDTERHGHEILRGPREQLTIEAIEAAEQRMLATMFNGHHS